MRGNRQIRSGPCSGRSIRGYVASLSALGAVAMTALLGISSQEIAERVSLDHFDAVQSPFGPATIPAAIAEPQLSVSMIGDSWISNSKMDDPMRQALVDSGLAHVSVKGIGEGGATSRRIFRNLISEGGAFSSASTLSDPAVEYCIVIAGVNDSAQHLGPEFYSHHVTEIARVLVAHGVRPLIVELPEYGIEAVHASRGALGWTKDKLFSLLFDAGEIDVVKKYRAHLRERLADAGLADQVQLVAFAPVVEDYDGAQGLYADPAHLNELGRARLARHLVEVLAREMERSKYLEERPVRFASR